MSGDGVPAAPLEQPDYLPRTPPENAPAIGLIGCGFISAMQLDAYRAGGLRVRALCDRTLDKARARRDEYFPAADVTDDVPMLLERDDIAVVDIATHVAGRAQLIEAAIRAGKHVLVQKPFVRDLAEGERLIALAREHDRLLAVNHNGRWAPHFAAALASVGRGDVGRISSADFAVYWPHDRQFEHDPHFSRMTDLVVFDFGIHWFDVVAQLFADAGPARRVTAASRRRPGARIAVATDVEVLVEFDEAVATLLFRAAAPQEERGTFRIEGSDGVILHSGHSLGGDVVDIRARGGALTVPLRGDWWSNGMLGVMTELLSAIEESRLPSNDAATALPGLALALAAQESILGGEPVVRSIATSSRSRR